MKHLILITTVTISTLAYAMEEQAYKMTIENQLDVKIFLNEESSVKKKTTETFSLLPHERNKQSIAIPCRWPNKVDLPIDQQETHFIIKRHPDDYNKTLLTDNSQKVIAELLVLSNPK